MFAAAFLPSPIARMRVAAPRRRLRNRPRLAGAALGIALLPPVPMTPLYGMFKAVTAAPLQVMAAFHEFTMVWLPGQVHVIFQVLVATVPVLLTVIVATKPVLHPLSTMLAERLAVPSLGVGVGLGVGVWMLLVRLTHTTVQRELRLKASDWTTITGRRNPDSDPAGRRRRS